MRKKVIALFLAGGLMLGMSGCGNSQSTASAPQIPEAEELHNYGFPAPGAEDVEAETLNQTETEETETIPEEKNLTNSIDTSSLLTEYVLEYEDYDGYQIRETIQISPIFRESDSETMYALWEALGNDAWDFPNENSLQESNHNLKGWNEFEYIIGTFAIENLTEGFPITADNPRLYMRALTADSKNSGDSNAANLFNHHSASAIMYSNGITYYGSYYSPDAAVIGDPKMVSNTWGPRTFVIAVPNAHTPNQPDGYRYDEVQLIFSWNGYGSYDRSNYETLTLEYFE